MTEKCPIFYNNTATISISQHFSLANVSILFAFPESLLLILLVVFLFSNNMAVVENSLSRPNDFPFNLIPISKSHHEKNPLYCDRYFAQFYWKTCTSLVFPIRSSLYSISFSHFSDIFRFSVFLWRQEKHCLKPNWLQLSNDLWNIFWQNKIKLFLLHQLFLENKKIAK